MSRLVLRHNNETFYVTMTLGYHEKTWYLETITRRYEVAITIVVNVVPFILILKAYKYQET